MSQTMAVAPQLVRAGTRKAATNLDAAKSVCGNPLRSSAEMSRLAVEATVVDDGGDQGRDRASSTAMIEVQNGSLRRWLFRLRTFCRGLRGLR